MMEVETLNLSNSSLQRIPVDFIKNNKIIKLKKLDLRDNPDIDLENLTQFTTLEGLFLSGCNLFRNLPDLSLFCNLDFLDLSRSNIDVLPNSITSLSKLRILYVDFNNLSSLPNKIFQMEGLRNLFCEHNKLTSLPSDVPFDCKLEMLDVSDNKLSLIPSTFCRFKWCQISHWMNDLEYMPKYFGNTSSESQKKCLETRYKGKLIVFAGRKSEDSVFFGTDDVVVYHINKYLSR